MRRARDTGHGSVNWKRRWCGHWPHNLVTFCAESVDWNNLQCSGAAVGCRSPSARKGRLKSSDFERTSCIIRSPFRQGTWTAIMDFYSGGEYNLGILLYGWIVLEPVSTGETIFWEQSPRHRSLQYAFFTYCKFSLTDGSNKSAGGW